VIIIPVVLVCIATGCNFIQGLVQYSESDCQAQLLKILELLEGLQTVGTCVKVYIS
jgi:hypothetical protein